MSIPWSFLRGESCCPWLGAAGTLLSCCGTVTVTVTEYEQHGWGRGNLHPPSLCPETQLCIKGKTPSTGRQCRGKSWVCFLCLFCGFLSQGRGIRHHQSQMLLLPPDKELSRAISPSCPPRERFHPASALRMSGQEDELPQRINYSCYLQMDQVSD